MIVTILSEIWKDFFCRKVIPAFYTGSDSKIGNRQGGCLHLCQAEPMPRQPNLNKLGDGGGHKGNAKTTQHKPIFESRAVYTGSDSKIDFTELSRWPNSQSVTERSIRERF